MMTEKKGNNSRKVGRVSLEKKKSVKKIEGGNFFSQNRNE